MSVTFSGLLVPVASTLPNEFEGAALSVAGALVADGDEQLRRQFCVRTVIVAVGTSCEPAVASVRLIAQCRGVGFVRQIDVAAGIRLKP